MYRVTLAPTIFPPDDGISDERFYDQLNEEFTENHEVSDALNQYASGLLSGAGLIERLEYLKELAIDRTYNFFREEKEALGAEDYA